MADTDPPELSPEEAIQARILGETAKIPWKELQRFFAQGVAILVHPDLDLVEAAFQITEDNEQQVKAWMEAGQLRPVSDEQAREWLDANALVWAVVVRPWVLVQPILLEH